jgi:hypothetical protein
MAVVTADHRARLAHGGRRTDARNAFATCVKIGADRSIEEGRSRALDLLEPSFALTS